MFNVRATDMVSHPPSRAQQLGRIGHSFSESNLQVLKEDGKTLRIHCMIQSGGNVENGCVLRHFGILSGRFE